MKYLVSVDMTMYIEAEDEEMARKIVTAQLGSLHGLDISGYDIVDVEVEENPR